MKLTCLRCGAGIEATSVGVALGLVRPLCRGRDLNACLNRAAALVEEPVLWLDLSTYPPADASVCRFCRGSGELLAGQDYETHVTRRLPCAYCLGTGDHPVAAGRANHHPTESEKRYAQWLARLDEGLGP